jgi:hypothetical protein
VKLAVKTSAYAAKIWREKKSWEMFSFHVSNRLAVLVFKISSSWFILLTLIFKMVDRCISQFSKCA